MSFVSAKGKVITFLYRQIDINEPTVKNCMRMQRHNLKRYLVLPNLLIFHHYFLSSNSSFQSRKLKQNTEHLEEMVENLLKYLYN